MLPLNSEGEEAVSFTGRLKLYSVMIVEEFLNSFMTYIGENDYFNFMNFRFKKEG